MAIGAKIKGDYESKDRDDVLRQVKGAGRECSDAREKILESRTDVTLWSVFERGSDVRLVTGKTTECGACAH